MSRRNSSAYAAPLAVAAQHGERCRSRLAGRQPDGLRHFPLSRRCADGKLRTGVITAESSKTVARELDPPGPDARSTSVSKKRNPPRSNCPRSEFGRRRDVLFFTQELSTLLNSGVPLDRALSITSELTTRQQFRTIVLDILRSIKGGKSLADSLALHPAYFSELFINMVRAGEASGSLGQIFERLSEFERSRDELRSYIVSSMIYPGAARLRGRRGRSS